MAIIATAIALLAPRISKAILGAGTKGTWQDQVIQRSNGGPEAVQGDAWPRQRVYSRGQIPRPILRQCGYAHKNPARAMESFNLKVQIERQATDKRPQQQCA